jgi:hypothetical protein
MPVRIQEPSSSHLARSLVFLFIAVFTALAVSATVGGGARVSLAGDVLIDADHQLEAEDGVASRRAAVAPRGEKHFAADVAHGSWPLVTLLGALRSRTRGS